MLMIPNIFVDLLMKNHNTLALFLFISFLACRSKEITPSQYFNYWQEYKDKVSDIKSIQNASMRLTYIPTDILILNDAVESIDRMTFDSIKTHFCEHSYFSIDINSTENMKEVKAYFMRDRQKQFSMIRHNDTLPCILYQPELSLGNSNLRLDLVFTRPQGETCDTPLQEDYNIIFVNNNKPIRFCIKKENINQLTKIKI